MKEIITIVATIFLLVLTRILQKYDVKFKNKCIVHNWKYTYDEGDYWKYNNRSYGRYIKTNERYVCIKCKKEKY